MAILKGIRKCGLPDVYKEVWVSLRVWGSVGFLMCMGKCDFAEEYGEVWPSCCVQGSVAFFLRVQGSVSFQLLQ